MLLKNYYLLLKYYYLLSEISYIFALKIVNICILNNKSQKNILKKIINTGLFVSLYK